MKNYFLIGAVLLSALSALSQNKLIALHHNEAVTYYSGYSGVAQAVNAAFNGDTIYIPGGYYQGGFALEKSLTLIGVGFHPDSTTATLPTVLEGSVQFLTNSDNTRLEGMEITGGIGADNADIDNVTISRIKAPLVSIGGTQGTNKDQWVFEYCIITQYFYVPQSNGLHVHHCIIDGYVNYVHSALFENNFFPHSGGTYYITSNCQTNLFRNNIFALTVPNRLANEPGNTYENNVFFCAPSYGSNTAIDNYESILPADCFVNFTGNAFEYAADYHLIPSAQNAFLGTDNTQAGLYGGAAPLRDGYVPQNPHISEQTIAPSTDENGLLPVLIKINAQQPE
jgi:hypothetical protein